MATNPTAMPTTMSPGTASRSLTILNPPVSEKRQHKKYPPKIGALKSKLLIRSKVYFECFRGLAATKCPGVTSKPSRRPFASAIAMGVNPRRHSAAIAGTD